MREKAESAMSRISDVVNKIMQISGEMNTLRCCQLSYPGGRGVGGTPIWNRRGCSSEILNLTPKGDHLGVAQAFCDP